MANPATSAKKSRILPSIAVVVLFTLYPILSLVASNASQLAPMSAARSAAVTLLASLLALLAARRALGGWERATVLVVGLQILFFSYGHIYDLMRKVELGGVLIGRHRYLSGLWGAAGLVWVVVVLRLKSSPRLTWLLSVGVVLVVMPILSLMAGTMMAVGAAYSEPTPPEAISTSPVVEALPDIYYIILDSYGRADVLASLYSFDNKDFIRALERRGFYVAGESRSNYSHTLQSLASTLNMRYLDDLALRMGPDSSNRAPLQELVQHSEVRRLLESVGYQLVAFQSGSPATEIHDAAIYYSPHFEELDVTVPAGGPLPINEFEGLLFRSTLLRPLLDSLVRRQDLAVQVLSFPFLKHRMRIIYTLNSVSLGAQLGGPQLVFAHVISPHVPFVLNQPGEQLVPSGTYTLGDDGELPPEEYVRGYTAQVRALNALVLQAVDEILSKSDVDPVIVIQADHGPAAFMDLSVPLQSNMYERMSILNAYHLPEVAEARLYPSITPVNTFRVVLEAVIGRPYDLLPDESYFAPWKRPYDVTLVTDAAKAP